MDNKCGLALSGGGYRATLFSLGSLWRFNMDGLLTTLDTITSLSGGSIAAAYLHYKWKNLTFKCIDEEQRKYRAINFETEVVNPLLNFCKHRIDISSVLKGIVMPFSSPAEEIAKQYDRHLFNQTKLKDIPNSDHCPEFVYYATNYDTGVSVRITKDYLSDYHLGLAKGHDLSIAKTVSISSAFPPIMAPVVLDGGHWQWDSSLIYKRIKSMDPEKLKEIEKAGHLWDLPLCEDMGKVNREMIHRLRGKLHLCDGGLYDNLALEMIWKAGPERDYATVFSCDSGAPFDTPESTDSGLKNFFHKIVRRRNNWFGQLTRMIDVMINQQATLRKKVLVRNYIGKEYGGAYWAIKTRTNNYPGIKHPISEQDEKQYEHLRCLPTRLGPFPGNDNLKLVNWGFSQADIALRAWHDPDLTCYKVPYQV